MKDTRNTQPTAQPVRYRLIKRKIIEAIGKKPDALDKLRRASMLLQRAAWDIEPTLRTDHAAPKYTPSADRSNLVAVLCYLCRNAAFGEGGGTLDENTILDYLERYGD